MKNESPNKTDIKDCEQNRQCTGKSQFIDKKDAKKVAGKMSKKYDDVLRAYNCPHCPFWHVGH